MTEIEDVELLDKRGYLTICICLSKDGKVYLRKTEGIRDWFRTLRVSAMSMYASAVGTGGGQLISISAL